MGTILGEGVKLARRKLSYLIIHEAIAAAVGALTSAIIGAATGPASGL